MVPLYLLAGQQEEGHGVVHHGQEEHHQPYLLHHYHHYLSRIDKFSAGWTKCRSPMSPM